MEDVLMQLRMYEYAAESFEEDNYPDATLEDVQQSKYEYMYLRNLGDYLEILIKKDKYSNEEIAEKMKSYFDKMYSDFQKNSKKSIALKKKATFLKNAAFQQVYNILEEVLVEV